VSTACCPDDAVHHEINYVEITVTDMVAARYFHGTAFGWRFIDYAR
jgi:uncharacterized protein